MSGIIFPQGYPTKLPTGRNISTCGDCRVPLQMPDPDKPGQLTSTPTELHWQHCSRRKPAGKTFKSGAKVGQQPASSRKRKD